MDKIFTSVRAFFFVVAALVTSGLVLIGMFWLLSSTWEAIERKSVSQATTNIVKDSSVDAGSNTAPKENFRLVSGEALSGSKYFIMKLMKDGFQKSYMSSDGYTSIARNYLFIDTEGGGTKWIFSHPFPSIMKEYKVSEDKTGKAYAFILDLIEKDTDGNQELTYYDHHSLFAVSPNDAKATRILEGVRKIVQLSKLDDKRFLVVYEREEKTYAGIFSTTDFSELKNFPLPEAVLE